MDSDTVEIHSARQAIPEAAFDAVAALLKLVTEPNKAHALRFRELREQVAAAQAAERKLADARAALAAHEQKVRAELGAEKSEAEAQKSLWLKRLAALDSREAALDERGARIAKLENAWKNLGEPDTVITGFQDAEHTALQKAQRAHAGLPIRSDPEFAATLPQNCTLSRDAG